MEASLSKRQGKLSGPVALLGLTFDNSLVTPLTVMVMPDMSGNLGPEREGICEMSSLENTELNWLFNISALDGPSEKS